ncbi:ADP-ribosyl cyclase/cyclic ADP-ribose hydrolase [Citrus sinensis]|nr:ADP-ribosyl cyclase/cyclic ADP-ribose hydrolase [Citrus sinensis]
MASSSSSSSLTGHSKYKVFLSFRGEDTRNGFTSHLAAALHRKQIQFFIDDEELEKGDEISPALFIAVETSDISVIILSKDYASSKWCLNELVNILDCKKMNGKIVIPVFYQVDPSDVRKQRRSFGEAFVHHENNFPDKVQKWRDALTEASNLSGYDSTESRENLKIRTAIIPQRIKKRLQLMKVLIVLDDVHDEFTELKSLARRLQFSGRSRIIITSRDKGVLDKCGVNNMYEVKGLKYNKALELFCRKAFRETNCSHDLLELSEEVVRHADGNPLALELMKLISEPNIYNVLKISYDELNLEEKKTFLDIACFFTGEDIDFVRRIRDDPSSLDTFVDKSLITIFYNELQMHDLLQEMGQTIVCQNCVSRRTGCGITRTSIMC